MFRGGRGAASRRQARRLEMPARLVLAPDWPLRNTSKPPSLLASTDIQGG